MKIKLLFFEIFFSNLELKYSTYEIFNSKFVVQKTSTSGGQSHLKLQPSIQKTIFFQLSMLIFSNGCDQTS